MARHYEMTEEGVFPLNHYSAEGVRIAVEVSGTIDFTIQETFSNIYEVSEEDVVWQDISALADKTANTVSQASTGARALKLEINTSEAGATIKVNIIQMNTY